MIETYRHLNLIANAVEEIFNDDVVAHLTFVATAVLSEQGVDFSADNEAALWQSAEHVLAAQDVAQRKVFEKKIVDNVAAKIHSLYDTTPAA